MVIVVVVWERIVVIVVLWMFIFIYMINKKLSVIFIKDDKIKKISGVIEFLSVWSIVVILLYRFIGKILIKRVVKKIVELFKIFVGVLSKISNGFVSKIFVIVKIIVEKIIV